jgi:23S rRNA (adenine2030-N6)-methyltransferase
MNYRHGFHAGNFADVLKHAMLCWIVRYLQQKEAPLCMIDTHAGAGVYDLTGPQAKRTSEAENGILRLTKQADVPSLFVPYLELIASFNTTDQKLYPGSPALVNAMARPADKVILCELHPEEAAHLRQTLKPAKNTRIVAGDGYRTLLTLVPPSEKRGLVLIDPPFEKPDELETLAKAVTASYEKWPMATYVLWVPIKDRSQFNRFTAELQNAAIKKLSLLILDVDSKEGLSACGLIIANAPFTLEAEWSGAMKWLTAVLTQGAKANFSISTLA